MTNIPAQGSEASGTKASPEGGAGGTVPQASTVEMKAAQRGGPGADAERPPIIANFQLKTEVINNVDALRVIAESAGGNGEVTFKYEWTKNGEPAGDDSSAFTGFKRGDRISVRVTPFDGKVYGPPRTIATEMGNLPPKIIEHKDLISSGMVFSYQVKATDPDGDSLTYSLKSAPQSMTIDSVTGLITWDIPPDFEGKAPVTVSVTDGHGGETFQSFTVDTKGGKKRP